MKHVKACYNMTTVETSRVLYNENFKPIRKMKEAFTQKFSRTTLIGTIKLHSYTLKFDISKALFIRT